MKRRYVLACALIAVAVMIMPAERATAVTVASPTFVASAQNDGCSKVNGSWQRSGDKLLLTLTQTECELQGHAPNAGYEHEFTGKGSGSKFDITVVRTAKGGDRCTTDLYGTLTLINAN